jgi:hypothetical protein
MSEQPAGSTSRNVFNAHGRARRKAISRSGYLRGEYPIGLARLESEDLYVARRISVWRASCNSVTVFEGIPLEKHIIKNQADRMQPAEA